MRRHNVPVRSTLLDSAPAEDADRPSDDVSSRQTNAR